MPDSAIWAFHEGKKRGGFSDLFLSVSRNTLDFCLPNSILISSGDNSTFCLLYLQILEKYRTDISVIDISLLNTNWYPKLLKTKNKLDFGVTDEELDFITYREWNDSIISIPITNFTEFTWTLKPSYEDQYLLRSDLLFLNLLKTNRFKNEFYFVLGTNDDTKLSLTDHLNSHVLVERILYEEFDQISFEKYKSKLLTVLDCFTVLNPNSKDELKYVDIMRFEIFKKIFALGTNDQIENAKTLFTIMDSYLNPSKFQFQSEQTNKYYLNLKSNFE